jgi:hypothetical protein
MERHRRAFGCPADVHREAATERQATELAQEPRFSYSRIPDDQPDVRLSPARQREGRVAPTDGTFPMHEARRAEHLGRREWDRR